MTLRDYKELLVWKKGVEIVDQVYEITAKYPKEEVYSLSSQMRRAAVSIPSNIAEGFMRRNTKEYRQFLYVSLGSCAELDTQLVISDRRKYLDSQSTQNMLDEVNQEMRMLRGLIGSLQGASH